MAGSRVPHLVIVVYTAHVWHKGFEQGLASPRSMHKCSIVRLTVADQIVACLSGLLFGAR